MEKGTGLTVNTRPFLSIRREKQLLKTDFFFTNSVIVVWFCCCGEKLKGNSLAALRYLGSLKNLAWTLDVERIKQTDKYAQNASLVGNSFR